MTDEKELIFDFGASPDPWPNIDDPVMGGRSASSMRIAEGIAIFEGAVSLENNGGFASVRSRSAEFDLAAFDGLTIRARGDGKKYSVRLRTNAAFDGVTYQASLTTELQRWTEVQLPFASFVPLLRGRVVTGHPPLDPTAISTFGLIIADRQEGPFRLEIEWIGAYRG